MTIVRAPVDPVLTGPLGAGGFPAHGWNGPDAVCSGPQQVAVVADNNGSLAPGDNVGKGTTFTDDHCITNHCSATLADGSARLNGNAAPDGGDMWNDQAPDVPNGYGRRCRRRTEFG